MYRQKIILIVKIGSGNRGTGKDAIEDLWVK